MRLDYKNSKGEWLAAGSKYVMETQLEGFTIWNMETEKYLCCGVTGTYVKWYTNGFSLINVEDITWIQLFMLDDNIPVTSRQIALFRAIDKVEKSHLLVVPCEVYDGEPAKLNFIRAFRFD